MIFSLKILKNYIYDVIFGAVDILSTGSLIFCLSSNLLYPNHMQKAARRRDNFQHFLPSKYELGFKSSTNNLSISSSESPFLFHMLVLNFHMPLWRFANRSIHHFEPYICISVHDILQPKYILRPIVPQNVNKPHTTPDAYPTLLKEFLLPQNVLPHIFVTYLSKNYL